MRPRRRAADRRHLGRDRASFLGTALRGTALPIGLGLVWILAIESLVVNVAAPLLALFDAGQAVLPGVNAGSLAAALAGPDAVLRTPGVAAIVGGTQAAWALAAFLVLFAPSPGCCWSGGTSPEGHATGA